MGSVSKTLSATPQKSSIVGKVRYHRQFPSKYLRYPRDIIVWLPPSYTRRPAKRYPVLYMQDGQNLFDPATSFAGVDWQVDETATRLIRTREICEMIVVGIYNSPDRLEEYSASAAGLNYARFMIEELKPFMDKTYRAKTDSKNTAAMGSSMGGLISFLLAWWYPEVFYQAACLSSSFLWNRNALIRAIAYYIGPKKEVRYYIDVGSRETLLRSGHDQMTQLLKKKGFVEGVDLEFHVVEGGEHNEASWGSRLGIPLQFLFGTTPK
jgi:predicted alpha/beta superfamily hydrolase